MVLKTTEMLWESDIVRCYQRHYHCFKCMPFHKSTLWCKMACALWQWTCKRISWFTAIRCYHPGHSLDNWHGTSPYIIPVFCANHSTWPLQLSPSLSWKCESCSSVPPQTPSGNIGRLGQAIAVAVFVYRDILVQGTMWKAVRWTAWENLRQVSWVKWIPRNSSLAFKKKFIKRMQSFKNTAYIASSCLFFKGKHLSQPSSHTSSMLLLQMVVQLGDT